MKTVNVRDAKTNLSRLLVRVARGEEIVIVRSGKPIARLVPAVPAAGPRAVGIDRGRAVLADDFDAPLPGDIAVIRDMSIRDAFDRILIAQAQVEGIPVLTSDPHFARYDVALLPA